MLAAVTGAVERGAVAVNDPAMVSVNEIYRFYGLFHGARDVNVCRKWRCALPGMLTTVQMGRTPLFF